MASTVGKSRSGLLSYTYLRVCDGVRTRTSDIGSVGLCQSSYAHVKSKVGEREGRTPKEHPFGVSSGLKPDAVAVFRLVSPM